MNRLLILHALRSSSMCMRSCCWTPWQHSAEAVNCRCHDVPEEQIAAAVGRALAEGRVFG